MERSPRTLVTGASRGIGRHLAEAFAAGGHPLLLLAPREDALERAAAELRTRHAVDVDVVACDLRAPDAIDRLEPVLARHAIDILVNNAGQGLRGNFVDVPLEQHLDTVRLNVEAVLRLSARLLPPMLERGSGGLLNVASITSFEPGPSMAVYHASKAFLLSWSESLATELAPFGITVTALCPGPTDTDFFVKAGLEGSRAFQQSNLMAPQEVARLGYEAFMRGERVAVAGTLNRMLVASSHLLPEQLLASKNQLMYEDLPPSERHRERGDVERRGRAPH